MARQVDRSEPVAQHLLPKPERQTALRDLLLRLELGTQNHLLPAHDGSFPGGEIDRFDQRIRLYARAKERAIPRFGDGNECRYFRRVDPSCRFCTCRWGWYSLSRGSDRIPFPYPASRHAGKSGESGAAVYDHENRRRGVRILRMSKIL